MGVWQPPSLGAHVNSFRIKSAFTLSTLGRTMDFILGAFRLDFRVDCIKNICDLKI